MEDFVVSARKYRPDTFESVVGQEAITTTLKNAIKNGHLAQSFLFCGPRGVGKTTCARILARTINCTNLGPDMEPCGTCESCRGFLNNASQNIYELDAASNRTVDSMRSLIEHVRIPPQVGKYKVYIIDEVHMLTTEAFNTFLKTLEEPPAYAKFILATTEKNKIIPTILSRCQIFEFKRIGVDDIVKHLAYICGKEGFSYEEEALRVIAQKADGGLRDALSMFDQIVSFSGNSISYQQVISMLNILDYETYFEMAGYFLEGNVPASLDLFNRILENGFDGQLFVNGLSSHFRSLLLMQDERTIPLMEASGHLQARYREQSVRCPIGLLLQALELCNQCDLQYRNSSSKRLLVEILLLQLVRLFAPSSMGGTREEAQVSGQGESAGQAGPDQPAGQSPISGTFPRMVQASPSPQVPPIVSSRQETPVGQATVQSRPQRGGNPLVPNTIPQAAAHPQAVPVVSPTVPSVPSAPLPLRNGGQNTGADKAGNTMSVENIPSVLRPGAGLRSKASLAGGVSPVPTTPSVAVLEGKETPFTQEQLEAAWSRYMASIEKEQPSLYSILAKAQPRLKENHAVSLSVPNRFAADDLVAGNKEKEILDFLRKELQNHSIHFVVNVDESMEPTKTIYTPLEKFQEMQRNNPELKNFRDSLNLDLEL